MENEFRTSYVGRIYLPYLDVAVSLGRTRFYYYDYCSQVITPLFQVYSRLLRVGDAADISLLSFPFHSEANTTWRTTKVSRANERERERQRERKLGKQLGKPGLCVPA